MFYLRRLRTWKPYTLLMISLTPTPHILLQEVHGCHSAHEESIAGNFCQLFSLRTINTADANPRKYEMYLALGTIARTSSYRNCLCLTLPFSIHPWPSPSEHVLFVVGPHFWVWIGPPWSVLHAGPPLSGPRQTLCRTQTPSAPLLWEHFDHALQPDHCRFKTEKRHGFLVLLSSKPPCLTAFTEFM